MSGKKVQTLRRRLILSTAIIVTATSTLFAGGLLLIKQQLEKATFGNIVGKHIEMLVEDPEKASVLNNPLLNEWRYYRGSNAQHLPEAIRSLPLGTHHSVLLDGVQYHLQVARASDEKIYLLYDISEWERQEHTLLSFLLMGVVIVLVLALLIAGKAADTILEPVRRLSERLSGLSPTQRDVRIQQEFNDSDIGQIAAAFDTYLERIDQFVERERSFTAAASHELRTPLSVMMGAVDIIEADCPNPATQRAVLRIRRACRDMLAFIEAALFLSREEERSISQKASCEVADVLRQLVYDLEEAFSAADITVKTAVDQPLALRVPESLLKITLTNLLRNAIEHSAGGTVSIHLKGDTLSIRDTGKGIAAADLPNIFERSYTTKAEGTGLGLNMVRRICDRYGWQVAVHSEQGKGTCVELVF
ncbi:HAMP domain-containing sensor histidine kinase [uncultured Spongiibacter sp.]|uniref:sensor histidine kinase n=1 Tax=uncultured Spongiibacter sp. TaxID=870896 RepID=UPI0025839AFD|nr:HAMP domain-containing sensor histidine kinase [uncultured Spongiibacter sp.]